MILVTCGLGRMESMRSNTVMGTCSAKRVTAKNKAVEAVKTGTALNGRRKANLGYLHPPAHSTTLVGEPHDLGYEGSMRKPSAASFAGWLAAWSAWLPVRHASHRRCGLIKARTSRLWQQENRPAERKLGCHAPPKIPPKQKKRHSSSWLMFLVSSPVSSRSLPWRYLSCQLSLFTRPNGMMVVTTLRLAIDKAVSPTVVLSLEHNSHND